MSRGETLAKPKRGLARESERDGGEWGSVQAVTLSLGWRSWGLDAEGVEPGQTPEAATRM